MGSRWLRPSQVFYRPQNCNDYDYNRIGGRFTTRPPGLVGVVKNLVDSLENVISFAVESLFELGHFNRGLRPIQDDDVYGRNHPPHRTLRRV